MHVQKAMNKKQILFIDPNVQKLVIGYAKIIQELLPQNNSYYNITIDIINIVLVYYYTLKFNEKHHGDNLHFIDDSTVKKIHNHGDSMCFFGDIMNKEKCDKLNIHIKWIRAEQEIMMGYINCTTEEFAKKGNMNHYPGAYEYGNRWLSTGIYVRKGNRKL